jgi:8-oxo-dGTP pyrophosphatase MutT (NUDIX family)
MSGWNALDAATRARVRRLPFTIAGRRVGSVAAANLAALLRFDALAVDAAGVDLRVAPDERDAAFAEINAALRAAGLIVAWRDETYPVPDPETLTPLARFERAASRFWGTLTFGAHASGWVAGTDGRPERMWIARRSFTKATDPGLHDNLIGGGVPAGQTPDEALVREGFEEAGLSPAQLAGVRRAGVLRLARDIPEGFQHEWLYAYDLELPPGLVPENQDGEVAGFQALPVADALAIARGDSMTVDAALVTIDFGARHGFVADAAALERLGALRVDRPA